MKSIFSICLLFTTAVSVSGQSEELNGIMGKSVTFPTGGKDGRLFYNTDPVAVVTNGKIMHFSKKFEGRLQWDSGTGFSFSGLKKNDSGLYKVVKNDGTRSVEVKYQLTVYVPVSKPSVSVTSDQYSCTLQCTVERGTEATLTWYREGEVKPFVSYPVRDAPYLDLPQTVDKGGVYTCEAKNSVSNERSDPLTVGDHCTASGRLATGADIHPSGSNTGVIVASAIAVVAILIAVFFAALYFCKRRDHTSDSSPGRAGRSEGETAGLAEGEKLQALSSP